MTERLDIGFSVLYKNASDGSEKTLIPFSRVNSHMVPEDGSMLCSEPGICMCLLFFFLHIGSLSVGVARQCNG